jgi:hypothetical protein
MQDAECTEPVLRKKAGIKGQLGGGGPCKGCSIGGGGGGAGGTKEEDITSMFAQGHSLRRNKDDDVLNANAEMNTMFAAFYNEINDNDSLWCVCAQHWLARHVVEVLPWH